MPAMAENKRKQPPSGTAAPATPSKKPCLLPSSPSTALPQSTMPPLLNGPAFERVEGVEHVERLPSDREAKPELPQNLFDVFALFCPASMVDLWAKYINERRQEDGWRPTYKEEIYLFFGVLLYMSTCPLPSLHCYWDTSTMSPSHPITRFMTRDRFFDIYRRFYTWDITVPTSSVFEKITAWSTYIEAASGAFWKPSPDVSVDEAMVPSTGKSKYIVHLSNKPISMGYKI